MVSLIVVWSMMYVFFFFFKQKTAYEMRISDWSSDVCSSDLSGRSAITYYAHPDDLWQMRPEIGRSGAGMPMFDHVGDLVREFGHHKWFGDNLHARLKMTIADSGILREPGYEKHLQVGATNAGPVGDLSAVPASGYPASGSDNVGRRSWRERTG